MTDRNNRLIWVKPFISYVNSDNEEQNDQCLVRRGGDTFFPSRQTMMSRDLIGTIVPRQDQRGSRRDEFKPRTVASHKAVVKKAWDLHKEAEDGYRKESKSFLNEWCVHPVENAYWSVPMAPGNIYKSSMAEILHLGPQGFMKKMRDNIYDMLPICWHRHVDNSTTHATAGMAWAVSLIESRMDLLPTFTDGITRISHFANGCWGLKWVSAEDHISMFQQLVCLADHTILPFPYGCCVLPVCISMACCLWAVVVFGRCMQSGLTRRQNRH